MDSFDREKFASVYRLLAEVMDHDRAAGEPEGKLSFGLGDVLRRVFLGSEFLPPDELLEQTSQVMRHGDLHQMKQLAEQLRQHATHLENYSP